MSLLSSVAGFAPATTQGRVDALPRPVLRWAEEGDIPAIRALDDAAFPARSLSLQRAAPGEIESGVRAGDVRLLVLDGRLIGYIHVDRRSDCHEIAGVAVRPECHHRGYGTLMIDAFLRESVPTRSVTPIVAVTSPRNRRMLTILYQRGFAVRWALRDYYGPRRDRFGCQLRLPDPPQIRNEDLETVSGQQRVLQIIESRSYVIRSLPKSVDDAYVLSPELPGEFLDCPRP
jgi:ribosomal protein S18 acetylase RimI-like enzyme